MENEFKSGKAIEFLNEKSNLSPAAKIQIIVDYLKIEEDIKVMKAKANLQAAKFFLLMVIGQIIGYLIYWYFFRK